MHETKIWQMLLKHLGGEDSNEEKEIFLKWLNQDKKHEALFHKVEALCNEENNVGEYSNQRATPSFLTRFSPRRIKDFILKQALGNLIGFIIGMWVTTMFSHHVLEKKGIKNLFGLTKRKNITVNEIPEWLQNGIAILVGFIVLELINHFFETKKHLIIWEYIKRTYYKLKEEKK